ncbi:MAG: hypothetical protein ABS87_06495 [Sphingomonas sp. SCN 67-18]|uniref:hypothetical protein n=1 Tax=uncultured Sphingomonas sp. TaxID=158754 RepID=UPI000869D1B1|nr:hypothetical protein [Sphingomonas sp. SCN 67-18]ODU21473.1 MAG: hypothetical protein ABS87_06495 [Sphingomonas sp. SCN 67-18]
MAEAKPFASLSSGLLARKGQAKPAMRPQGFSGFSGFGGMSGGQDDLGWNDMGFEPGRPQMELAPVPGEPIPTGLPPVIVQREQLAEELGSPADDEPTTPLLATKPANGKTRPVKRQALDHVPAALPVERKTKAAFTLRLDPERHLKLRLACAVGNRSAQQLVTEALDLFLQTIPAIDDLADRVPARKAG